MDSRMSAFIKAYQDYADERQKVDKYLETEPVGKDRVSSYPPNWHEYKAAMNVFDQVAEEYALFLIQQEGAA